MFMTQSMQTLIEFNSKHYASLPCSLLGQSLSIKRDYHPCEVANSGHSLIALTIP